MDVTSNDVTRNDDAEILRIFTDRHGVIVEVCGDPGPVLNMSSRGLEGRLFHLFFTQDRPQLFHRMDEAWRGHAVVVENVLRPRDRSPRTVYIQIRPVDADGVAELEWLIEVP